MQQEISGGAMRIDPQTETWHFGYPLLLATGAGIVLSWCHRQVRSKLSPADLVLMVSAVAAAGIPGANAMGTSVASFKIGLAAFIVPFMFFYSPAMLMEGSWMQILRVGVTATLGIVLLSGMVQAWFFGPVKAWTRLVMLIGAIFMIYGGIYTDIAGLVIAVVLFVMQRKLHGKASAPASG